MAAAKALEQHAPRRWALSQKRHIVELTLCPDASISAIAREHGVSPTSLSHWRTLYRTGRLEALRQPGTPVGAAGASATLLPISITPEVDRLRPAQRVEAAARSGGVVQLTFASGATVRIETDALDAALVSALMAEVRR
ncbi:MAG: transposase [Acetobacteraceae bacterium]